MTFRLIVTLVAFVTALGYFSLARGYPPGMALLVALALAALVFTAQGTGHRLRRIHTGRPERQDRPTAGDQRYQRSESRDRSDGKHSPGG